MWRTVSELWSLRLTRACGVCCRADCIAQWCLSLASCKRAGQGLVSLKTARWAFFAHFSHNFVTTSLSHTTVTRTIFLCNTHHLSHTALSHTTLHTQLFYFSILHRLLCLSFLPRPRYNICCSLLEEVDLWSYPVLWLYLHQFLWKCIFMYCIVVMNLWILWMLVYVCSILLQRWGFDGHCWSVWGGNAKDKAPSLAVNATMPVTATRSCRKTRICQS